MAEGWFEVRAVVHCDEAVLDKAKAWLTDSDVVEVNRIDVVRLDDDLRRWDGARPPGVVVDPMPEPCVPTMDLLEHPPSQPVMDRLRRGLHLHEQ